MSLMQHPFAARFPLPSLCRTAGRTAARLVLGFRRRPARLVEEDMPAWQLRDLGLRDGRDIAARRGRFP